MPEHQNDPLPHAPHAGWRAWRVFAALLLIAAAGLKAHQLVTSPVSVVAATSGFGSGIFAGVPFLAGVVVAEILLAGWLLSMVCPAVTRWLGVVVFTAFAGVALTKALGGAGFAYFRPERQNGGWSRAGRGLLVASMVASVVLASAAVVWIATAEAPATLADGGDLLGDGAFVILEPETWVGQPCPLLPHIDTQIDLAAGDQTVVLYSHTCSHCIASIPGYEDRARGGESVVLVAMPPHAEPGQSPVGADSPCGLGRLSDAREWFVQTPAEIRMRGGQVVFAQEAVSH